MCMRLRINGNVITLVSLVFSSVHGGTAAQHDTGPSPNPLASSHRLSPAAALVFVLLVLFFLAIGFSSVYIRWCSNSPQPPLPAAAIVALAPRFSSAAGAALLLPSRRPGLDPHLLEVLPTFAYGEAKGREDWIGGAECAVCLSEFDEPDTLRLLPWCGHAFHVQCIDKWLAKHVECPVCRSTVAIE
ncbi:RING-H2 finger protein ATL39 [Eucalyptus grandis]|uniref:RING-H2 finger protein ATL39 n=1 Tax=Eucalyptus grandis TaxID=71139 RepID=UPI00192EE006|nr:RING-H2 finger protein ATL39 [Eucalyptus grandis]